MITIFDTDENKTVAKVDSESMSIKRTETTEATKRYLTDGDIEMIRGYPPEAENVLVDEEHTTPDSESELIDVLRGRYADTPLSLLETP